MSTWHKTIKRRPRRKRSKDDGNGKTVRDQRALLWHLANAHSETVARAIPEECIEEQFVAVPNIEGRVAKQWHDAIQTGTYLLQRRHTVTSYRMQEHEPGDEDILFKKNASWPTHAAFPIMQWTNNGRQREWLADDRGESHFQEAVRPMTDLPLERYDEWTNPLAGLIAVASESPDIVKNWPTSMRLEPNGPAQNIGTAQVPGLVHLLRKQLLHSACIAKLENAVDAVNPAVAYQ